MSRIYEALKRAETGITGENRTDTLRDRLETMAGASPVDLTDYPEEQQDGDRPRARSLDRTEKREKTARVPIRASVANKIAAVAARMKVPAAVEGKVVIDPNTPGTSVEQYRRLAATLHQAQIEHGIRTIMVSSAVPHEGKTLTSVNLALTLSASYARRVLLIDADLRRPSVHNMFGVPNAVGLGDVLRSGTPVPLIDVNATLTLLPAGRPDNNPTAALTSARMKTLLEEAAKQFDWVIVDSPPVALLSDASLIKDQVDGAILVIGAGTTDYRLIQRAIDELGRERILGAVLNRVDDDNFGPSEYYHYYRDSSSSDGSGAV